MGLLSNSLAFLGSGTETEAPEPRRLSPFEQFAADCDFTHICILENNGKNYRATRSIGFSNDIENTGTSSKDFWDGTIPPCTETWTTVAKDTLVPYFQLFPPEDRGMMTRLHIRRVIACQFNLDYIILVAETTPFPYYEKEALERSVKRLSELLLP